MALTISMAVWQSVLFAHGCQLDSGTQVVPLQLEPIGECLHGTPRSSGLILPFNIAVCPGETVTIAWDRGM